MISNRVAVPKARGADGAQGGLAGALSALMRSDGGLWFGWSGQEAETPSEEPTMHEADGMQVATLDLSPQDVEEYYNGYANATLWPLFHYRIDLTQYQRETGKGYERVNALFADRVRPLIGPDDTVWVHDYHFLPLGSLLRARGVTNRIGFVLHIPWPPANLFVSLPYHERLARSVLAYDLVGFQAPEWLASFLYYCQKELGAEVDEKTGRIVLDGHVTYARTYPIGIDWDHFTERGQTGEARQTEQRVRSSTRHRHAAIGVDRLDYTKGLPERLDGLARFFERFSGSARELIYIQIAPPSREDVASYQQIREVLERKTGHINGEYSQIDTVPIRYVNQGQSPAELFGCYRAARMALVTPLRDGMNLVAKEYIAAQDPDDPGVLILSRFAGAAHQLPDALLVNPHSPDEVAEAIEQARTMPLEERQERWTRMAETVRTDTVQKWAQEFCADLNALRD